MELVPTVPEPAPWRWRILRRLHPFVAPLTDHPGVPLRGHPDLGHPAQERGLMGRPTEDSAVPGAGRGAGATDGETHPKVACALRIGDTAMGTEAEGPSG
jgi:hypothetical protein